MCVNLCKRPTFVAFKDHLNIIWESEYIIAQKGYIISAFKKYRFEISTLSVLYYII